MRILDLYCTPWGITIKIKRPGKSIKAKILLTFSGLHCVWATKCVVDSTGRMCNIFILYLTIFIASCSHHFPNLTSSTIRQIIYPKYPTGLRGVWVTLERICSFLAHFSCIIMHIFVYIICRRRREKALLIISKARPDPGEYFVEATLCPLASTTNWVYTSSSSQSQPQPQQL